MPQPSYPYAAGRVRSLEARLLSADRFVRMAEAKSVAEAARVLRDAGYGAAAADAESGRYESLITAELAAAHRLVQSITPDPALTDIFLYRADYHNAKALIKMRAVSGDESAALTWAGLVDNKELEEAVFQREYIGLPDHLVRAITQTETALERHRDPRWVDIVMDRAYVRWAQDMAKARHNAFMAGYLAMLADLENLLILVRARFQGTAAQLLREALLPGGALDTRALQEALTASADAAAAMAGAQRYGARCGQLFTAALREGRLWELEKFRDDCLTRYVRARRWEHFSIEPVVAWLLAKEAEARAVRMVMAGKVNGVPEQALLERLRELYA